jgi:hypothetical protein
LHLGYTKYNRDAATKIFNIAALGLHVLGEMEKKKFNI